MGINRDSRHKKRLTGGRMPIHKKKRAYEKARPVSNTKLDLSTGKVDKRVRHVRVRGGNYKFRALRIKEGNFNWSSESTTKKARIINVVYNASNNELVRTNTLVKNCIVLIDATPFKAWYQNHYGVEVGPTKKEKANKKEGAPAPTKEEPKKRSKHVLARVAGRQTDRKIDAKVEEQFGQQRLLACISSRPGQCGRVDGYILEGKELEFYARKIDQKRKS